MGKMMDRPTIIITGASSGLGAAAAYQAARMGASVVLAARSLENIQTQARKIEQAGGQARVVAADISSHSACQEIIQQAIRHFGRLDALVDNAGAIEPIGPVASVSIQEWEMSWLVNVLGPLRLTQLALPHLRTSHGRIINLTSGSTSTAIAGWSAYSTAKAAINQLTRILAAEEPSITTLAVLPGIVDTRMQATIREKGKGRMAENNYLWLSGLKESGKLLPPDQPGRAIACLALYAPIEWSGEIIQWDEERVQKLIAEHA